IAHELAHIRSPRKAENTIIKELDQKEEIDSIRGKALALARKVQERADSVDRMRKALADDTEYGSAAPRYIFEKEEVIAELAEQGDITDAIRARIALDEWVRKVYMRRKNIDSMQTILTAPEYKGYDIIIISSSTPDEAASQQEILDRLFAGRETANDVLGNKVCVLSVVDESEGGQIIGQGNTWRRAVEKFRSWAGENGLEQTDLDEVFRQDNARIAVYHNGGKGERASPATQALKNSRAAQELVGDIITAEGRRMDLQLLTAILLGTAPLAQSNDGSRVDTFWANQISFGTLDFANLQRTGHQVDKFVIKVPEDPDRKDLFDYGTTIISETGQPVTFLANKSLAERDSDGNWVINEDFRDEYEALMAAPKGAFDFGSFSMSRDMHYALLDYWTNVKGVFRKIDEAEDGRAGISRDIEPALVQVVVPLVNGLKGRELPELPAAEELRSMPEGDAKEAVLERAYADLKDVMGDNAFTAALDKIYNNPGKKDFVLESVEFFILYNDRIFSDMDRVVGNIDMGEDSHWFAYKRILDLSNEKFLMLSDLIGKKQELGAGGQVIREPLDENALDAVKAEDARRMRGIREDAVARFMLNGKVVTLTAEQVREGWEDVENNVTVKGSVIQGNTVLLPGSEVINSVVNDSQGLLFAVNSYVEGTTAKVVNAQNSIIFMATDQEAIDSSGEIIADAYRPDIRDDRFPEGQTRIRAPLGYDPKGENYNDKTIFGDNRYAPQVIREMDVAHERSDAIMALNRTSVRTSVAGLADHFRMMALSDPLGLTAAQYAAVIDLPEEEARNELNALVEDGIVMTTRRVIFDPDVSDYVEKAPLVYKMVPEIDRGQAMEVFKKLKFGTSGLRDDVRNMTDMEVYINTAGYIRFLHEQNLLDRNALNVFSMVMDRRPSSPRMAAAAAKAIEDMTSLLGYRAELDLGGRAPSPAGAYRGQRKKSFSVIVTGSHIPFDMNGIKFYLKNGEEVLKAHEKPILAAVERVREDIYSRSWQGSIFDDAGMFKDAVSYDLYASEREVNEQYSNRYLKAYPADLFVGQDDQPANIVHWQHSAVGRDVMADVLRGLGANVIVEERTDYFVPVDTEKITPEMDTKLKDMARRHAASNPVSVVFTDGDSDRPGITDENGNFLTGDKLGLLVAKDLAENIPEDTRLVAAVPVTTNYGVVEELEARPNVEVIKTSVGSPHVVKAMNDAARLAEKKGEKVFTLGWEANGGFLLGSAVNLGREDMTRIASRDAIAPVLSAHRLRKRLDMPMSEVFRTQIPPVDNYAAAFDALMRPVSEGGYGLDRETADRVKEIMVSMLSPELTDERAVFVDFAEMTVERRRMEEIDGEPVLLFQRETVPVTADNPDLAEWTRVKELLEEVFSPQRGFGPIRAIDILDGIQVVFDNKEVSQLRPSGNDPNFRNYAMAHRNRGVNRPREIGTLGVSVIIPELAEKALDRLRGTTAPAAEEVYTPIPAEERWTRVVHEGEKVPGTDVPRSKLGVTYADFGGVEGVFDQATIIDRMGRPGILEGREHVIAVTEGAVTIESEDQPAPTELPEGAKMRIPSDFGDYIIRKAGNGNAAVKFDYVMTPGEKAVYSAYDLMNKHWEAIHNGKIDILVPSEMFVPGGKDTPGSSGWEEEQLKKYFQSENIRLVPYSAVMGLEEAATRTVRKGAQAVLVATRSNIALADRSSQRVRTFLQGDPREGIPGVRVLAIPDIDKEEELSGRGWYFTREVEATALLLSTVTREMIETKGTGNAADDLQQLMTRFTGTEIPREYMYYLLSYGEMGEEARMKLPAAMRDDPFGWMLFLVQNMLLKMPIRPYDPNEQLNQRRQMLWSA
ncbi:MAG: hypothetical protein GF392_00380, partial [Candidatus Omnitrophica bacterium]|nr:hypothetical protein [Candidatus Omnitrophota bacterium]